MAIYGISAGGKGPNPRLPSKKQSKGVMITQGIILSTNCKRQLRSMNCFSASNRPPSKKKLTCGISKLNDVLDAGLGIIFDNSSSLQGDEGNSSRPILANERAFFCYVRSLKTAITPIVFFLMKNVIDFTFDIGDAIFLRFYSQSGVGAAPPQSSKEKGKKLKLHATNTTSKNFPYEELESTLHCRKKPIFFSFFGIIRGMTKIFLEKKLHYTNKLF
uniref:Uncharacterized protein n=1 Tax=Romanomermis culicivorax TaxID=13658 RepID=A0A915JG06_ROMCU